MEEVCHSGVGMEFLKAQGRRRLLSLPVGQDLLPAADPKAAIPSPYRDENGLPSESVSNPPVKCFLCKPCCGPGVPSQQQNSV